MGVLPPVSFANPLLSPSIAWKLPLALPGQINMTLFHHFVVLKFRLERSFLPMVNGQASATGTHGQSKSHGQCSMAVGTARFPDSYSQTRVECLPSWRLTKLLNDCVCMPHTCLWDILWGWLLPLTML